MKKIIICFAFGLLLYGCNEINEPVKVDNNMNSAPSGTSFKIAPNQGSQILIDSVRSGGRLRIDSTRAGLFMFSDSVIPRP